MQYSDKLMDHYEHPRNVGSLDQNEKDVGTGMVGAPACGDVMRLQIKVSDKGIIEIQNLWLWFGDRFKFACDRVGERQVA